MTGKSGGGKAAAFPHFSILWAAALIMAAMAVWGCWWLLSPVLVIGDGIREYAYDCCCGESFSLRLTHSVEKTPWEDKFLIRGPGDLLLTESKFESLGWGYPYSRQDGAFRVDMDRKFVVELNRPFKKINTCISVQAMPKLYFRKEEVDLCPVFGDGALVEIKVERRGCLLYKKIMNFGGVING